MTAATRGPQRWSCQGSRMSSQSHVNRVHGRSSNIRGNTRRRGKTASMYNAQRVSAFNFPLIQSSLPLQPQTVSGGSIEHACAARGERGGERRAAVICGSIQHPSFLPFLPSFISYRVCGSRR